jgi:hypothetical protein
MSPTGVAFYLLFLATQVLLQVAALGLVCVLKHLMAHWQTDSDLLGADRGLVASDQTAICVMLCWAFIRLVI